MANLKITQLTELTTVADATNLLIPVVNNGTTTFKITLANLGAGVFPLIKTFSPSSSTGDFGDKRGDIVFTNSFFYYCVNDFTNSGQQIWQRIAKDATAW